MNCEALIFPRNYIVTAGSIGSSSSGGGSAIIIPKPPLISPSRSPYLPFLHSILVRLISSEGYPIIYTLNGKIPAIGVAAVYTQPIIIVDNSVLVAAAVYGGRRSEFVSATFLRGEARVLR